MSDNLCINIVDFIIKNNLFSENPTTVHNLYVASFGNAGITEETIAWVLEFIKNILNSDIQILSKALAIDKMKS